ncbi:hypothetical protein GCM10023187_43970 [Nibrella viscosa]|uniref:Uncharacterized protein n=1 Tax=Nibrella viscosa TaxID=1084524 RepID=A0ABP8KTK2_9BACT
MANLISERTAVLGVFATLTFIVLFHATIMLGIIPFDMVWGGRMNTRAEMLRFEAISIAANLVMLAIVAVKGGFLRVNLNPTVLKVVFWLMCGLFLLNTLGNLLSTNPLEKLLFTPLTLILSVLCFRLAISR